MMGLLWLVCILGVGSERGWAKKPGKGDVVEKQGGESAGVGADLNAASMRVSALDAFYQLDLSAEQLKAFAANASPMTGERAAATGDKELAGLLEKLQGAILSHGEDSVIAGLRNQVIDHVNANSVELDDVIRPSAGARAAAKNVCNQLKATQVAAFLAMHADEVGDPMELFGRALDTIQSGKGDAEFSEGAGDIEKQAAAQIGRLVAGMDDVREASVEKQVAELLKSAEVGSDADLEKKRGALEESARKIVGEVGPFEVVRHWMEERVAELLANPEMGRAAGLMLGRDKSK